jgi:anti-sigma factor RsiW
MTHEQALDGLASERYLLDEMTEDERFEFEAHFFDCIECAEDVKRGDMIRQEVRRAGSVRTSRADSGRPAVILTSAKWWRKPMVAAPWAVAATLALVTGYQSLVTVPGLRGAVGPQSIEPVMLRGATRGATTTVSIASGQRFVVLSADLMNAPQSSALTYEILDSNRTAVASGPSAVPASGVPLMLLIPVAELQPAGRYSLVLRDTEKTVIGEYEFEVSY